MTEEYSIDQLEKIFRCHAEDFEKNYNESITKLKENGGIIPLEYPFNISHALHVICREINQIKNSIEHIKDEVF